MVLSSKKFVSRVIAFRLIHNFFCPLSDVVFRLEVVFIQQEMIIEEIKDFAPS